MTRMTDIDTKLQRDIPAIRVVHERLTLNAAALRLLDVTPGKHRIVIRHDIDHLASHREFSIWIGKSNTEGYLLKRKGHIVRINSVTLCQKLACYLAGYATYRIEEQPLVIGDTTYYRINPKASN